MFGRKIIPIAILLYLLVVGCVMWPTSKSATGNPPPDDTSLPTLVPLTGLTPF